jgi:hypothetical protein
MENLEFQSNTHIVAVYYNGGNANLFMIHIDITLSDLEHYSTNSTVVSTIAIKEG